MKIKIGLIAIAMGLMLTGCSNEKTLNAEESPSENTAQENVSEVEKKSQDKLDLEQSNGETVEFKIYTADSDNPEKIIEFKSIHTKKDATLEANIGTLLTTLKTDYFKDKNISMTLQSISEDGIANIDFSTSEAWAPHFSGSTGGSISQSTIVETLLQKDYKGEWIKGINISIDGEKEDVFDHASFVDIFYR